ncbi:MAG: di-heme oxidoredictase family protein [Planctomycetota bacterium]|nr:di-heme oxidoredictase family protein [Planctomycetota bacterium]
MISRLIWGASASLVALLAVAQDVQPVTLPRSGGAATVDDASANAFGFPAALLSGTDRQAFAVGNSFFRQNWVEAPSSTTGRDGLGPLFNARSCSSCHSKDGRSRPPDEHEFDRFGLLFRVGVKQIDGTDLTHPIYGEQLQDSAVLGVRPEARISIRYESRVGRYGDGSSFVLLAPQYEVSALAYGALGDDAVIGARTAPQLIGAGLLEAVSDAEIMSRADEDDRDGDGVSGRAHLVRDGSATRVGRFGWKATQPDVPAQVAAAFVNDMGITSSRRPNETISVAEHEAISFASGGEPEIEDKAFERVVFYTRALAVPAARHENRDDVRFGRRLFGEFGCNVCHTPILTTGDNAFHPGYARQTFAPFTDLLLHDMGPGLADPKRDGDAEPAEWRTPPLWGIGLVSVVNGHTRLLHDGRARDVAEAILWHGGEAESSRERFRNASRERRQALIAFVESL